MEILGYISVVFAVTGTILNAYKKRIGFYFWLLSNGYFVFFNFKSEIYFQAILFLIYTFLCFIGLYQWRKKEGDYDKKRS
jgi:nicotinamide riboside transporter PnuC